MSIVLRIENLDCKSICNKIQKFLQKNKPDPEILFNH